ncbi:hypothetical protein BDDG_12398 [Blastomyces dermatitidis ATCC 18188]|uniref:Uncharacterized protein n=1 Tax=Ajellomyces dermatitidis (strain ATCC 18188 / CBS 674.68) TaxID=653446 RepID=A0A0J9EPB7_AJEDA|nr:hypothetical protein BDDG_12398 [Blastomyces dermatitidis ATCC 18188]
MNRMLRQHYTDSETAPLTVKIVAKLHHQINTAVEVLEDVKNTLTPGLTRRLNKIFKSSMIQVEQDLQK